MLALGGRPALSIIFGSSYQALRLSNRLSILLLGASIAYPISKQSCIIGSSASPASAGLKHASIRNRTVRPLKCIGLRVLDLTVLPEGEVRAADPKRFFLLQPVSCGGEPLLTDPVVFKPWTGEAHVADPGFSLLQLASCGGLRGESLLHGADP